MLHRTSEGDHTMSKQTLSFTSIDGTREGRASYFFRNESNAVTRMNEQNARAESKNIKTRYQVVTMDLEGIESK